MRRLLKLLAIGVGVVVVLVAALLGLVSFTAYAPPEEAPVDVACTDGGADIEAGRPFTLVSWNLQYGGSRKHRFFYDGGDAVHVPRGDVDATVSGISAALRALDPQVALLQEIDRDSARTHRVDQLPAYVDAVRARCVAAAPYHLSPFVPAPTTNPLGRVDMELGVLSRGGLSGAVRHQLALLDEPWIRAAFNLKRALLTAEVPVKGLDHPLAVAVTHLSAFSHGDGTLQKQVAELDAWMASRPSDQPWILAGDMNLLPPGDDPSRLGDDAELYADASNPIAGLLDKYGEVFTDQLDEANRTYLPFGAAVPDRKIDYVFVGGPVSVIEARVAREHGDLSDHLPLVVMLRVGPFQPGDITALADRVEGHFGEVGACYEEALAATPHIGGRVEVKWTIDHGAVTASTVESNNTGSDALAACLADRSRAWVFDSDVSGDYVWPFNFLLQ